MASKAVWGIDLGQCALKAIKLSYDTKEDIAIAEAFDYVEHPKILSQPDADPEELIKQALEKFISRNEVEGIPIFIGVPGQAGLLKFVQLPPVESKKIPDIVKFEAKQQIPFPLDEVAWDYQKIGGGEEEEGFALETEVGIFAIKKDTVHRHLAPYKSAGMRIDVVQLAPLALYNFAAFDYFWHGIHKKGAEGEKEGAEDEGDTVVVLDMGADKTDMIATDGDTIWHRNLPIGGNHFTRALSKEIKQTFAKSEHLKRNATRAADPKSLYKAMRPVFQDFANELQKSIGFYQTTHRDAVIRRVVGVGNGFKLPGLQKFLQQNLNYEIEKVEKFHGMTGDEVTSQATFAENLPSFCVAYGLALQGLEQTPIQTNLLPQEIRSERLVREKKPYAILAASVLLLIFVISFGNNYRLYRSVSPKKFGDPQKDAQAAVSKFDADKNAFKSKVTEIKDKSADGEKLLGVDKAAERYAWIKLLRDINEEIPIRIDPLPQNANVETLDEVNIDYVEAAYVKDLKGWKEKQSENAKLTMNEKDKDEDPGESGWVVRLLGTSHNKDPNYISHKVLTKLQGDRARGRGISQAVLNWIGYETDANSGKPSPLLQKRGALARLEISGPETETTTENQPSDNAPRKDDPRPFPREIDELMKLNQQRAKDVKAPKIGRHDFIIEFLWNPEKSTQEIKDKLFPKPAQPAEGEGTDGN